MIDVKIAQIIDSTGAQLLRGGDQALARGVSTDTRLLEGGEFFIALSGPNFDGNAFAREAARRGAAGVMLRGPAAEVSELVADLPEDLAVLVHEQPRRALSDLASWHRERLAIPVIGVTGSCGKTTTKNILVELLALRRSVVGSPSSFNNDIGVPHTLFLADRRTEALVVEMGTNHPGEIAALCRTARPTAGIITNVGASHLEGLGCVEGVADEKGELARSLPEDGFCVLNADCRWTSKLRSMTTARVISFSVEGEGDLDAGDVWFHSGGTTMVVDGREVTFPLLGLHNVQNLLAALAACLGLGLTLDEVLPAVSRLSGGRRRMERIDAGDMTVFDDTYNANPESARASVRVLAGLYGYRRRVLVLGDMLELGELSAELHHAVGVEAARAGIDLLVCVGDLTRATAAGALEGGLDREQTLHYPDLEAALGAVCGELGAGDVVLIKGSRRIGLERLVERVVADAAERGGAQ
ncbi:MAG: UDP-N-acetylmuramoyl-tripeptide--D-alanyl-D-alanine ligase [Planctomycetota bacterium]|nr:UDP-N-acetylmuramoyl-tripeptide--D-alanyl-D-alanine ligase [Planctomycetota bacterium]MDP6764104.1 UDP-N-acetylmuramoyl-tripeptide--D-alanyl-D-alanine ligase [Planctomycetota bacterium]